MAAAQTGERYRKLPGHRRGFWNGSSVWMGSDHLLLVKSFRFREEYKRFYLRDVQSIVVARRSRFHISSRALGIAVAWLFLYVEAHGLGNALDSSWPTGAMWTLAAVLVVAWLYVSEVRSCTCRIYTAVSGDVLPSVYRTWTARRFLDKVGARISEVQGVLDGDWAEAAETVDVGPQEPAARPSPGQTQAPQPAAAQTGEIPDRGPRPGGLTRTLVSDVFLANLFAGAGFDLLSLRSFAAPVRWTLSALLLAQLGGAIGMLVQYTRGILGSAMKNLAIATLVLMGLGYYAATLAGALAPATGTVLLRQIGAGAELLLVLIGIAIMVRGAERGEPDMMKGLNSR